MTRRDWSLTPEQRNSARAALKILDGSGISLEEAARRAVAGRPTAKRTTATEAADAYLAHLTARKARPGTYAWMEQRLGVWIKTFGEEVMDNLQRSQLKDWIASSSTGEDARRKYAKAIRTLWLWALRQDPPMVSADITAGLVPQKILGKTEIRFLSVAECEAIMAGAGDYRDALALGLFAGLRPEELAGIGKPWICWKHVNVTEKLIRVPGEIAKTRTPRIIEGLPETLWAWLKPDANVDKKVSQGRARQIARKARDLAGYGLKTKKGGWPVDAIRHTFATYAVALLGESGKVSKWLGHEGNSSIIHRHYAGLATKAEAEKFWALRPQKLSTE